MQFQRDGTSIWFWKWLRCFCIFPNQHLDTRIWDSQKVKENLIWQMKIFKKCAQFLFPVPLLSFNGKWRRLTNSDTFFILIIQIIIIQIVIIQIIVIQMVIIIIIIIQVVGGGSGGIASARRAAEFGVKVNLLKKLFPDFFFSLGGPLKKWFQDFFYCYIFFRWALWREVGWGEPASM